MPDVGDVSLLLLVPPNPLHFLTIIHYLALLFILVVVISPAETGGTVFLILLGVTGLLIVADIYGAEVIRVGITLLLIRVGAVAIPIILAGTAEQPSSRQVMGFVALLGLPSVATFLFLCGLDPAVPCG